MQTLRNIEISYQELERMRKKSKTGGSEADVLFLKDTNGRPIARKIFKKDMGCKDKTSEEQEQMRENKCIKIIRLYDNEAFRNDVKILKTISCNGQFVGYDMTRNPRAYALYQLDMDARLFISFMNQVKAQLNEFHEQGIVYGDINNANILIDPRNRKTSFCDLDNMQVESYPIDLNTAELRPFMKKGILPPSVDTYMLNLTILETMTGYDYPSILFQLKRGWKPKHISKEGTMVLQKMSTAQKKHQYDGDYLMPYMKKR